MGTCFCQTGSYKEHWVCFRCRKMLKKPPAADLPDPPAAYRCPECGEPLHNLGKEFAPPRRCDIRRWREIESRHREIQAQSRTIPLT